MTEQYYSFESALNLFVRSNGFMIEKDNNGTMPMFPDEEIKT